MTESAEDKKALLPAKTTRNFQNNKEKERLRTVLAFFLFGTLIYGTFSLIISGAQDILAGTYIQTSLVLVASIAPYFGVTLIAPYFIPNFSYFVRISTVFLTGVVGFVMVVLCKDVGWKLMGVGVASIGYGVGEVSFLGLTTYFHHIALSAYSAGTGAGFVLAPLYYTAMTTWLCVSPNTAILVMAGMQLLLFLCYYIMDKKHLSSADPDVGHEMAYIRTSDGENRNKPDVSPQEESKESTSTSDPGLTPDLTWKEKVATMRAMLPMGVPLVLAWFSEYLIIQAVITTISFPNAPFRPRDHYQYYIFVFLLGEVIGRSYRVIITYAKPSWLYTPTSTHLWVLSLTEVLHLLFFLLVSWFRFLPGVDLVLVLCLTGGITIGCLYSTALALFSEAFEGKHREFVMGYAVVAMGCGTLLAGLIGLAVEPALRAHCVTMVENDAYCFTRARTFEHITSRCHAKNA